jgi:lipoyl(octanoyl) transferase
MARFLHLSGLVPYTSAHVLQRELLEQRIRGEIEDTVLLLEHAETITVGRTRGAQSNVLTPDDVPVISVERGGDVTWHGPGQLVAYPIVQLTGRWADLHRYLRALEQAVIELLVERGLRAARDERNTGVWLPSEGGLPRKVCSVGVACRKWVTWHGLALNVTPDLARFQQIRPCGFEPDVMTRLADHMSPCPPVSELVEPLAVHLSAALELPFSSVQSLSGGLPAPPP